ncbi:MAG: PIG-L family deacetylase [Planctomycetia bacterium]|nr:PIG-L family deacetylase [Planctomycetia bacterium]
MSVITFNRRSTTGVLASSNPADIFPNWQGANERWLFLSPHDDDIICGCGLTFIAALESGITTFAGVVTNGKMGYCTPEERTTIADTRKQECTDSFTTLGLPKDRLYFLGFDDGSLNRQGGRRFATGAPDDGPVIENATGLQNSLVWLLRQTRPNRLFVPTFTDLHPDHKFTNSEAMISIFHAQGSIWPELGEPIPEIPAIYEYAAYSNFLTPPTLKITVSEDLFERKINGILQYKSQKQIDLTIKIQRENGVDEFIREAEFDVFDPKICKALFAEAEKIGKTTL